MFAVASLHFYIFAAAPSHSCIFALWRKCEVTPSEQHTEWSLSRNISTKPQTLSSCVKQKCDTGIGLFIINISLFIIGQFNHCLWKSTRLVWLQSCFIGNKILDFGQLCQTETCDIALSISLTAIQCWFIKFRDYVMCVYFAREKQYFQFGLMQKVEF